ncbi:MAG TPA: hypothetical protein VGC71_14805 [Gaiellales bacterium]|jgi:hypothetical protein
MRLIQGTVRRIALTAVVVALIAAAVGGVSLARAGGSGGPERLVFNEIDTGAKFVNISHTKNGAPGDEFIFSAKLVNRQHVRIGRLDAKCTLVLHGNLLCEGAIKLRGGTITLQAVIRADESANATDHIAVTGGTGRFDEARGELVSTTTSENTSHDVLILR